MNVTEKARTVLKAINERPDCGANYIADKLWPDTHRHMSLRAGQYVGRLVRAGFVRKRFETYTNRHGETSYMSVSYTLTEKGQAAIKE